MIEEPLVPRARPARASSRTLWLYGLGSISPAVKGVLLDQYLFYYYNQLLGLDAMLVSTAMCISLIIDGIVDPLIGYHSDRLHTPLGRRHPFVYASIVPSTLFYYGLLTARFGSSQRALFAQLVSLLVGLRVSWACYEIPRGALGPELTKDYDQRTQLSALSMFWGWTGGAGMSFVTKSVFLSSGYDAEAGYLEMARGGSAVLLVAGTIFAFGTHHTIGALEPPANEVRAGLAAKLAEVRETLSNPSWLVLFLAGVVSSVHQGVASGLDIYLNRHFWDWTPQDRAEYDLTQLACVLALCLCAPRWMRGRDKRRLALRVYAVTVGLAPLLVLLRLVDLRLGTRLLPPNGPKYGALWWVTGAHLTTTNALGSLGGIVVGSMMADVVEDSQAKTGRRAEGLFFAGPALLQKAVSGFGFLLKGALLTAVGFSAAQSDAEKRAAVRALAAVLVLLAVSMPTLALRILSRYRITRATHEGNLVELGYAASKGKAKDTL